MRVHYQHRWDLTPQEAMELQSALSEKLILSPFQKKIRFVAGVDAAYTKKTGQVVAAIVVLKMPELEVVEIQSEIGMASFPYVQGLLAFRELPLVCKAFEKLQKVPDVVICDAQGIAHPRGFGLASHLGLLLNVPTIGCAKKILVGDYKPLKKGQWSSSPLYYHDEIVGTVINTKQGVNPMFISPGHLIDLPSCLKVIKECVTSYRLPDPVRQAHHIVTTLRRELLTN